MSGDVKWNLRPDFSFKSFNIEPLVLVSFKLHGYLAKAGIFWLGNTKAEGNKAEYCRSTERTVTGFSIAFTLVASFVYWTGRDSLRGTVTKKGRKIEMRGLKVKSHCVNSKDANNQARENRWEWLKYKIRGPDMSTAHTFKVKWCFWMSRQRLDVWIERRRRGTDVEYRGSCT